MQTSWERPDRSLITYYAIFSLVLGPFFPAMLIPLTFRYRTMRYRFDEQGVTMRWGVLFRREISLTYARLQDIHLTSNVVERWLGLARVQLQTASGSAKAEMTIEGLPEFEAVRNFLYDRMRGARHLDEPEAAAAIDAGENGSETLGDLVDALHGVADELAALRSELGGAPKTPTEETAGEGS